MIEWRNKFDQDTLERGRSFYVNGRVDLTETEGGYTAAVRGKTRIDVSLGIKNGKPVAMKCRCPVSRGGRNCEHLAAALYAIEAREKSGGDSQAEQALLEAWRQEDEAARQAETERKAEEERLKREKQEARERRRKKKEELAEQVRQAQEWIEQEKRAEAEKKFREDNPGEEG